MEPEKLAAIVAPIVAESVAITIKQIYQTELPLLIESVNAQVTATLKFYLETQLTAQKQEFQATIDELKFQHYQQLEKLGRAVEQVMTPEDESEEFLPFAFIEEVATTDDDLNHAMDNWELANLTPDIAKSSDGDLLEEKLETEIATEPSDPDHLEEPLPTSEQESEEFLPFSFPEKVTTADDDLEPAMANWELPNLFSDTTQSDDSPEIIYEGEDTPWLEEEQLDLELEQELCRIEQPDQQLSDFADRQSNPWHLGIDFGEFGIRVSWANQTTGKVYELPELNHTNRIKQFLDLGIPYRSSEEWQPKLKWTEKFSLKSVLDMAQDLFSQIKTFTHPDLDMAMAWQNLATVVLAKPHTWSDAYGLNLREAVLNSGLAQRPEQIIVIDQAIAHLAPLPWHSLLIDGGALHTTMVVKLPERSAVMEVAYGGLAMDQDIVLNLLYPSTKDKLPTNKSIKPGQPEPTHRLSLQRYLSSTAIGLEALAVAEQIKLGSPTRWHLGGKDIFFDAEQLSEKIFQPYFHTLETTLAHINPSQIHYIQLAGKLTELPSLQSFLATKFPHAQISLAPSLANQLASAFSYANQIDINRHQYSDYFLLQEICALNLSEPFTLDQLRQKLQIRGVNTKACGDRLQQILVGQVNPIRLSPFVQDSFLNNLLNPEPHLFVPVAEEYYVSPKLSLVANYLKMLESSMSQSLSEPLLFPSFL